MNKNLDTGTDTKPGEYRLADQSYGKLLLKLAETTLQLVNAELKQNIIHFFSNGAALNKEDDETKSEILSALGRIKN